MPSVSRFAALLGAFALAAAACHTPEAGPVVDEDVEAVIGAADDEPGADDEPEPAVEQTPATEHAAPAPAEPVDEAPSPSAPAPPTDTGAPPPDPDPRVAVPDDHAGLGGACRAYLRSDIPRLVVEVAHQRGAAPQGRAVDHLLAVLDEVVDKPAGVDLVGPRELPGNARTWTADELRAFAAEHRTRFSTTEETAMFVLSVRGGFERSGVLGVAISATEFVLFPDQIGDLAVALLGGTAAIERAVLVHEAGHLLCLVNITYQSEIDHEDPEHPHHSIHRDSVMHWAIPNDAISRVFAGAPPARFHPDDLADLEGLRTGRY